MNRRLQESFRVPRLTTRPGFDVGHSYAVSAVFPTRIERKGDVVRRCRGRRRGDYLMRALDQWAVMKEKSVAQPQ